MEWFESRLKQNHQQSMEFRMIPKRFSVKSVREWLIDNKLSLNLGKNGENVIHRRHRVKNDSLKLTERR